MRPAYPADACLVACAEFGIGRIVVVTDSLLFGDEHIGDHEVRGRSHKITVFAPGYAKRYGFSYDLDTLALGSVERFHTIVMRRSPAWIWRPSPDTTPVVTVFSKLPSGLPIAIAS